MRSHFAVERAAVRRSVGRCRIAQVDRRMSRASMSCASSSAITRSSACTGGLFGQHDALVAVEHHIPTPLADPRPGRAGAAASGAAAARSASASGTASVGPSPAISGRSAASARAASHRPMSPCASSSSRPLVTCARRRPARARVTSICSTPPLPTADRRRRHGIESGHLAGIASRSRSKDEIGKATAASSRIASATPAWRRRSPCR